MGAKAEGLTELIDDLKSAAEHAPEGTRKVVKKGAQNIKTDWVAAWTGYAHIPHLPRAISYDEPTIAGTSVQTEIGPVRGELQAGLGPYIEVGTINNAPIPGAAPAADAEEPRLVKALEDMGAQLLEVSVSAKEPVE